MANINLMADVRWGGMFWDVFNTTIVGSQAERPNVFAARISGGPDYPLGAAFVQGSNETALYSIRIKNNSETWVDVSSFVTRFSVKRSVGDMFHKPRGGEAKLTLFNECQSFGQLFGNWNPFSGVGGPGSFSDLARPYRAIEITAAWSLASYPLFYGTVKDIRIETGKDNDVSITACDQLQSVFDKDIVQSHQAYSIGGADCTLVTSLRDYQCMSLFKSMMPTSYGFATIGVSCDAGVGSWSVYMYHYNSESKADAIKELIEYGGFAVYATTNGNIRVRDGVHKATSYFPFSDATGRFSQLMKVDVKIDRFDMVNKAMCKSNPGKRIDANEAVVFQINSPIAWDKPIGTDSYYLDVFLETQGVAGAGQRGSPVDVATVLGVDEFGVTMATNPAGHEASVELFIYGSRCRVTSRLNSSGTVTSLSITGRPFYAGPAMLAIADNLDSQSQYEVHKEEYENRFWNTWSAANYRAVTICSERAFPPIDVTAQMRNIYPQILQIDLLDRLFIPRVVTTSKCCRVYEITHDVNIKRGTLHTVTYRTEVDTFNVSS